MNGRHGLVHSPVMAGLDLVAQDRVTRTPKSQELSNAPISILETSLVG